MTQAGVFDRAEQRLAWLGRRQHMLQTVAGAGPPGSQPYDLMPLAVVLAAKYTRLFRARPAAADKGGKAWI